MIILEGPDGSGKSTLAKYLDEHGYTVIKQPRGEAFKLSTMSRLKTERNVVFDRWGLTTWVYRIFDYQTLDECDFAFEDMLYILRGETIIYCTNKNAFENSIRRGEINITTREKAHKIRKLYDFVIATIKLYDLAKVIEYDFEKDNIEDLLKEL